MNDRFRKHWPSGDSPMAALVRETDWAATPLGPVQCWPQGLRIAVDIALGSRHPMFVAWGPQLTFIFNDAYAPLLGTRLAGAMGRPFAQLWTDIWADIKPLIDTALAGGATWAEDLPLVMTRNGFEETAYFTFSYSPIHDETGAVAGMFCAVTETTGKVLAEHSNARLLAEQRDAANRLREMFEQAPGFMAVHRGPEHTFELCNNAFRQLFGQRDVIGRTPRQVFPEIQGQGFLELLDRVYASGEPFIGHALPVKLRQAPGAPTIELYVDLLYQPLRDADGRVYGIFQQGHDVTERQRLIEQLREADQRKDEFLAMLAHELRNPLAPLTNALWLLERGEPLTERGRSALAVAQRQRAQLARLVDDLLEVARITRGRIELRCEPMHLNAAVSAAVESLMPTFEHRRQRVAVRLPEQPVRILADSARVAQILENLLTNASKYTPEGGAIRVELDPEADVIELRVIDNGLGIDPDKIAGLFELFHQLDATLDRAQGGLGIGLALVKRLVDLHGGSVAAHSAGAGQGACFTVRLPHTV